MSNEYNYHKFIRIVVLCRKMTSPTLLSRHHYKQTKLFVQYALTHRYLQILFLTKYDNHNIFMCNYLQTEYIL